MGRESRTRALSVWINGQLAAEWRIPARGDAQFQYDPNWVGSAQGRPLSLSLPFSLDNALIKGAPVDYYFDNLRPDSEPIQKRIQDAVPHRYT